jgi:hypothetical protein
MRRALLPLLTLTLAGCGGSSPTSPDPHGLTGTFTGVATDQTAGAGTVIAGLTEAYGALTGTWRATGAGFESGSYSVNGSIFDDNTVSFTVCPGVCFTLENGGGATSAGCQYSMKGSVTQGAINATYTTFGQCAAARTGSVTLTRQ